MPRSVRLRPWQKRALTAFDQAGRADFLAVATPGAGKTTFALTAAIRDLAGEHGRPDGPDGSSRSGRRVVVVAPTAHLKSQWAGAAAALGLHLAADWSGRDGVLPRDLHGAVVTYQQVAADPDAVRRVADGAFAIFDELHHAGEERAWGAALAHAFERAGRRLALSGTPFRSDTQAIPFVRYDGDEAEPDFVYGYADALAEGGVVRSVRFPRVDGEMEWTAPDGERHAHTFDDPLDRVRAGQRLRTALSAEGEWLPAVLERAHGQLLGTRRHESDAGGLVIAMDQAHARAIASLMRERVGISPVVAVSEDPDAGRRIARFAQSDEPWIVAVRMVSEGVDIPRLRVGVFATNVVTELFFRQAVGRLVRVRADTGTHPAHLFIPDDVRLRAFAAQIGEERRHVLRRREEDETEGDDDEFDEPPVEPVDSEDAQLSLFEAISARTLGDPQVADPPVGAGTRPVGASVEAPPAASPLGGADEDDELFVELTPPPVVGGDDVSGGGGIDEAGGAEGTTREARKKTLRDRNAQRARELARLTGKSHKEVNAELNRLAGVRRVTEATLDELERRADRAQQWLRRL
ncbi:DEAD/DEAH box helicase [Egibacter rhizosphaerae]|nr:DEAD/DEAH box helicase family protein [Egibacter rhizosphaerae]